MLGEVQQAARDLEASQRAELKAAVVELREAIDQESPDTGEVVKEGWQASCRCSEAWCRCGNDRRQQRDASRDRTRGERRLQLTRAGGCYKVHEAWAPCLV